MSVKRRQRAQVGSLPSLKQRMQETLNEMAERYDVIQGADAEELADNVMSHKMYEPFITRFNNIVKDKLIGECKTAADASMVLNMNSGIVDSKNTKEEFSDWIERVLGAHGYELWYSPAYERTYSGDVRIRFKFGVA